MKSFLFIIAILALVTGCASTQQKREHWDGVCVHPFLNGGMPSENVWFDGISLGTLSDSGEADSRIVGAQCFLRKSTKDAAKK